MKELSNVKKGCQRDRDILDTIEMCKVMNTDQIQELFFKFPSGKRKCQARMKSLYDKKLVNRIRLSLDTPTIYYVGKFPGQPEHSLAATWAYVWMMRKQGERVLTWDVEELKEFDLRTDVLCSTKILMTGEIRWYCIEIDRGSVSRNEFKKVSMYDEFYQKEGIPGSKLMKRLENPKRFPKVLFITDKQKHIKKINDLISEAKTNVKYEVYLLSAIKEGLV